MESNAQIELEKGQVVSEWLETASSKTPSFSDDGLSGVHFDNPEIKKLETRLLRKIDLNVLPLIALRMLISFLVCRQICYCLTGVIH